MSDEPEDIDTDDEDEDEDQEDILNWMKELDIPITRQNYIEFIHGDDMPLEWTAENEMQLPADLQDWSKVVEREPPDEEEEDE